VAVPAHIVYRLPEELSFEHATLVEPLSVAVHAVARTPLSLNDTAVVVGSGMIGLRVVQVLRAAGCGRVIAVDLAQEKLDLARTLGADVGLKAEACDVGAEVREMSEGRGADIAFEVVGATAPAKTAVECLRKGGSLTLVGNLSPAVELPLQTIVAREISLYGSCASRGEYPACLDMIASGRVSVEPLISAVAPLSEGAEWFARLYGKEPGLMKVILKPQPIAAAGV
jgi:L-iditol 2-dehydrogenase